MSSVQPPTAAAAPARARSFSTSDLAAGAVFTGLGLIFGITSLSYDAGTALAMGPAMFPRIISGLLIVLGVVIAVRAFIAPSREPIAAEDADAVGVMTTALEDGATAAVSVPTRPARFGHVAWRPLLFIIAAVLWFAFTIDGLGLAPAALGTVMLGSYASTPKRWWHPPVVAIALTVATWLIFVVGLQLRAPLLGDWLGG